MGVTVYVCVSWNIIPPDTMHSVTSIKMKKDVRMTPGQKLVIREGTAR